MREVVAADPANLPAILLLLDAVGRQAGVGYDDRIAEDTNLRTNLAFEVARLADQAVQAPPEDPQARLVRGMIDVEMPFFVGKLDQGIEDLQFVLASDAPESTRSEALYWLGVAHRKQGMTHWIEIVTQHPASDAARRVFAALRPVDARLGTVDLRAPRVEVELTLGYQDELPPQLAVWIEDAEDRYVRTLFVSGFSGHVRSEQIVLPTWAEASEFAGIEGVTGASIDRGRYQLAWDLRDNTGVRVAAGTYRIRAEAHFWPSMQYQLVSGEIEIGGGRIARTVEEGDLIPSLAIAYLPGDGE